MNIDVKPYGPGRKALILAIPNAIANDELQEQLSQSIRQKLPAYDVVVFGQSISVLAS